MVNRVVEESFVTLEGKNYSVACYDVNIFLGNITSIFSLNVNVEIAHYVIFFRVIRQSYQAI